MRDDFELDNYEQQIEDEVDEYAPVDEETRRRIEAIAEQAKKRRNVNSRISERDLRFVKERAAADGVPYQTLITRDQHRFVTDRLVDEGDIRRILEFISSGGNKH